MTSKTGRFFESVASAPLHALRRFRHGVVRTFRSARRRCQNCSNALALRSAAGRVETTQPLEFNARSHCGAAVQRSFAIRRTAVHLSVPAAGRFESERRKIRRNHRAAAERIRPTSPRRGGPGRDGPATATRMAGGIRSIADPARGRTSACVPNRGSRSRRADGASGRASPRRTSLDARGRSRTRRKL